MHQHQDFLIQRYGHLDRALMEQIVELSPGAVFFVIGIRGLSVEREAAQGRRQVQLEEAVRDVDGVGGQLHRFAPSHSHIVAIPVGLQGPFGVLPTHEGHKTAVRVPGLIFAFDKISVNIHLKTLLHIHRNNIFKAIFNYCPNYMFCANFLKNFHFIVHTTI